LERSAKRRVERVRRSFSGGGPRKRPKLRLAGQLSNVLRLSLKIGVSSKTAIRRIDSRSATTT
jgi:hypothetical protein